MTRHVLVAALLCAAAAAQTVTVSVFLSNEASGDIPSLAQEVSDPHSARYGQYMSRSQVAEKFGAPPAAADAVKAWFKANTKASSIGDHCATHFPSDPNCPHCRLANIRNKTGLRKSDVSGNWTTVILTSRIV